MNKKRSGKNFLVARKFFTLLAAIFSICTATAQQNEQPVEDRFLFIFSTSADMKPRVPATQKEIDLLLSMAMAGELHEDDTMGVWTFGLTPRAGQFPLQRWQPDDAEEAAAAIDKFVGRQSYARTNNYQALHRLLDEVIRNSPRLTISIFCDGETDMSGTPYDADINQIFLQQRAELKKNKQPFVVVLRTQEGEYVGASVNFSAGMVNLPPFPAPQPAVPAPAPAPIQTTPPNAPPKPTSPVFPLVIIGTHVETNWEAYDFALTNVPPENETASANATALPANTVSTAGTNAVASSQNSGTDRRGTLALAAGFFLGAIALTTWFIFGSRRGGRGSLISHSMKK